MHTRYRSAQLRTLTLTTSPFKPPINKFLWLLLPAKAQWMPLSHPISPSNWCHWQQTLTLHKTILAHVLLWVMLWCWGHSWISGFLYAWSWWTSNNTTYIAPAPALRPPPWSNLIYPAPQAHSVKILPSTGLTQSLWKQNTKLSITKECSQPRSHSVPPLIIFTSIASMLCWWKRTRPTFCPPSKISTTTLQLDCLHHGQTLVIITGSTFAYSATISLKAPWYQHVSHLYRMPSNVSYSTVYSTSALK